MPMHDWTRVEPTIFHHFHQRWATAIADVLNAGLLPSGYSALLEQHTGGVIPDVLTVERRKPARSASATATMVAPTARWAIAANESALFAKRANRIAIRHRLGEVVCIIEIVSPGNKASRTAVRQFLDKTLDFLHAGVNVLLLDPFPPTPRDPFSLHKLIWDDFVEDVPFSLPPEEPLLLAAYRVGDASSTLLPTAYLEAVGVGGTLPDMPAWLHADEYINVPLESCYAAAWASCSADYKYLVEYGELPTDS